MVAGLRDNKEQSLGHYPWENYWIHRLGIAKFPDIITFDSGLNEIKKDPEIISPTWFDRMTKSLLEAVKSRREVCSVEDYKDILNSHRVSAGRKSTERQPAGFLWREFEWNHLEEGS